MTAFKDLKGDEWQLDFDAFTFDDIRKDTGIDLAEQSGGGYMLIDSDSAALVRVLAAACKDQLTARGIDAREFARRMKREAIENGRAALWGALPDFFPPKQWSEIQSNLGQRRQQREVAQKLQIALSGLDTLPPDMRAGAMEALQEIITETMSDTSSATSAEDLLNLSALGQPDIPSKSAIDEPESAEITAVG
jgi:hypothetical protein